MTSKSARHIIYYGYNIYDYTNKKVIYLYFTRRGKSFWLNILHIRILHVGSLAIS